MNSLSEKVISQTIIFIIAIGLCFFLPAWSLKFWQAWVYLLLFSLFIFYVNFYFLKHDPALLERRLKAGAGDEKEKSQKVIQGLSSIFFASMLIIPGFDFHFHWSYIPTYLVIISDCIVVIGWYIIFRVFKENSFTSGIIEVAENQRVISTGPYAVVRHPMYSGALLMFFFTPLALGSYVALFSAVGVTIMVIIRLLDEEKFLKKNLNGYKEYCAKVSYRLVPYIW